MEITEVVEAGRALARRIAALGTALVCAGAPACSGLRPDPVSEEPVVVARVGDREITRAELDEASRGQSLRLEVEYKRNLYRDQTRTLAYLVNSELIEAEAARRGITPTELMEAEVRDKAEDVSDQEIQELYDRYRDQVEGSLEDNRQDLLAYLVGQKTEQYKQELLQRLHDEAGVETFLAYPELPTVELTGGEAAPSKGPVDAPVTIVEFSDFECSFCKRIQGVLDSLLDDYPGQIRLEYRHFPVSSHPLAFSAAQASQCADEQGSFWDYHDSLFENQQELSEEKLAEIAQSLGLDVEAYGRCVDEERYRDLVRADAAAGREAGVQGTPSFFVNGHPIFGADSESVFRELIDRELTGGDG